MSSVSALRGDLLHQLKVAVIASWVDPSFLQRFLDAAVRFMNMHAALEPALRFIFLELRIKQLHFFPLELTQLQA